MFAVIKTGGKQYRVAANDRFEIERLPGVAGDSVSFTEVLMVGTTIGAPFVAGATVVGEIVEQTRGPKVISFKKRRRQNSKRTRGHRQDLTMIRISEILTDGRQPSARAGETSANETAGGTTSAAASATVSASAADDGANTARKPRADRKKGAEETTAAQA